MKSRAAWRYCLLVTAICLSSSLAYAQETDETGTVINSNPPGAAISLEGDYTINATTPCRLPDNLNGMYKLRASMPGYESWSGDIMIAPGKNNYFSFSLASKNRYKAALRSLFFPGWGQYYAGQRTRAYILNAATLCFGIFAVKADSDFRKKRDEYFRAQVDLANATFYEDVAQLRSVQLDRQRAAYDAETTRNTLIGVAVGMYVYNILDAIVFFPEKKLIYQGILPKELPKVEAGFNGEEISVKLTASF